MELALKPLCLASNAQIMFQAQRIGFHTMLQSSEKVCTKFTLCHETWSSVALRSSPQECLRRRNIAGSIRAVSADIEGVMGSTISFEGFTVSFTSSDDGEIKIRLNVSGAKSQAIFDDVFSKLVAAAQPIPGFRRVKGGKTPDIPKDVLLHILGPSKVKKQAIKKIINTTVAEYVAKEGLKVTKDLRVEQSFEELEACFEPGKDYGFDAILKLQRTESSR